MQSLEIIYNNRICCIYPCKLGATLITCQQHFGLWPSIIMSAYRYLRILYFFVVLQWQLCHCFCPQSKYDLRGIFAKQLSADLLHVSQPGDFISHTNLSCLVITVWDNNLVLSLYPSHACWWPSYIFFANCCHTWGNIILQQCLLKSFAFGCWLENKLIHPFLTDKKLCFCKSFAQILCPLPKGAR